MPDSQPAHGAQTEDPLLRLEVAYLGVAVTDLDATSHFYSDIVGMVPDLPHDGYPLSWRIDEAPFRFLATRGPKDDITLLGIEAATPVAYDEVLKNVGALGVPILTGSDAHCADRRVEKLSVIPTPWGMPIELVLGFERIPAELSTPLVPGGFLTEGLGFGHAVFEVDQSQFEESRRFLEDGIGMVRSDSLEMKLGETLMRGIFYHCNRRHHSIALAAAPFGPPGRNLHHFMLETTEVDGMGAAYERILAEHFRVTAGLGRHDNDRMFSFYAVSPAGFQVEVGWGARQIVSPWTDDRVYDRPSQWGHVAHA